MAAPAFVDLTAILRSRDAAADLLARLAAKSDVISVLRAIGVLVTSPGVWTDSDQVQLEVREHDRGAVVSGFTDRDGVRERVLPDVVVPVPLEAIVRSVREQPDVVSPARPRMRDGVLVLTTATASTTPPAPRRSRSGTRKRHKP